MPNHSRFVSLVNWDYNSCLDEEAFEAELAYSEHRAEAAIGQCMPVDQFMEQTLSKRLAQMRAEG